MKEIDWSKAPEGATHKYPGGCWYKVDIKEIFVWIGGRWAGPCSRKKYEDDGSLSKMIARNPEVQWSGEGLPPVGVVCEFHGGEGDPQDPWHPSLKDGAEVTVIAHYNNMGTDVAVFTFLDSRELVYGMQVDQADDSCFRPIRTQEQIAAEEREKAVSEMAIIALAGGNDVIPKIWLDRLHEAGYRKQVQP